MRSRTKRSLDDAALARLVGESFGAGARLSSWTELTDGMYNAAYHLVVTVSTRRGQPAAAQVGETSADVVVKVAPAPGTPVLTYEQDLMRTEADFYTRAASRAASVPVPVVVHAGFDHAALDGDYLVMSLRPGRPLSAVGPHLTPDQRRRLRVELGGHVAALHRITGDTFGYPQRATGLQGDTWREAFTVMVDAVLDDAGRFGVTLPVPPSTMRRTVADHADALDDVREAVLTHFDLWDGNILVDAGSDGPVIGGVIDAERAFWGDPHADLASLTLWRDVGTDDPLLAGYRRAGGRIDLDASLRRRLHLYRAYLDLVMLVEAVPRGYDSPGHERILDHATAHLCRQLQALGDAGRAVIAVLTSGVALGVHVPGLLLARRLAERGVEARVEVFERLLPPAKLRRIDQAKRLFRHDRRAAIAGSRLTRDLAPALDAGAVAALLARWHDERVDTFVVFSGFWSPVVERFLAGCGPRRPAVDLCHVDSCPSPSWHIHASATGRHIWLLDAAGQEAAGADADVQAAIPWTIPVTDEEPVSWSSRAPRVLCHGGGWGMGTYRERAGTLLAAGVGVDVVIHDPSEAGARQGDTRYFVLDPDWEPWHDDGFPPFGELLRPDQAVIYRRAPRYHGAFDRARRSVAIVSKPGGGTLLDSLWSATPVVLLDPVGDHEAANARLWERLGFGLPYGSWIADECATAALEPLHRNLQAARPRLRSYVDALVAGTGTGA